MKPITYQATSADGVSISLTFLGGSGPHMLICHATGFHGHAYLPYAAHLLPRFQVWVMDFRGHGSSQSSPSDDYRWSTLSLDVLACVETIRSISLRHGTNHDATFKGRGAHSAHQITTRSAHHGAHHITSHHSGAAEPQIYGFGHSMGGTVLLHAEKIRPKTFKKLFLYEPVFNEPVFMSSHIVQSHMLSQPVQSHFLRTQNVNLMAQKARRRRQVFKNKDAALSHYASRPPLNLLRSDALAAYVHKGFRRTSDGQVELSCEAEVEALTFEGIEEFTLENIGNIPVATLIASGHSMLQPLVLNPVEGTVEPRPSTHQVTVQPAYLSPILASQLPLGEHIELTHLSHFGPLEAPCIVAESVKLADAQIGNLQMRYGTT